MNEPKICSICGAALSEDEAYYHDGQILCEDCFEGHTALCDHCSRRIWRDDAEGDDNTILCVRCYENHYTACEECGRLIHNEDAIYDDDSCYYYCDECYRKLHQKAIKSYNYKPEPMFHGSGLLFMGVELEIDRGGENHANARELLDLANGTREHIYCKHDGSLQEGFEIVSHPMTLDYHKNVMNWPEVFAKALEMDYASHNTSTCGLHVHCNRTAFGTEEDEQEASIGRVVFFIEKNWNELTKFSRRKLASLERWAARYATISNTAKETYEKAKSKYAGRYVAVNLTNEDTIEFRLFRGTLRYATFLATLQLVEEICICAMLLTDEQMEHLSWSEFVRGIDAESKPELIDYLKSKNLYVNDAVETNESEEQ